MCDCIAAFDDRLAETGLRVETTFVFCEGKLMAFPLINTEKLESSNRKVKTLKLIPTYCPFCGNEYIEHTSL